MVRPTSIFSPTFASFLLAACAVFFFTPFLQAQYVLEDTHDPKRYEPDFSGIPFVYYADEFRFAGGLAGGGTGLFQPQTYYFGAALAGVNGSYGGVFGLSDLQVKPIDRIFADFNLTYFHYEGIETYVNGNPRFSGEIAGSNGSSQNDSINPRAYDFAGDCTLKYILPIGGGRNTIINHYIVDNGLYQRGGSGGSGWNPLHTGRTYLQLTPFFEYDKLDLHGASRSFNCAGARMGLQYDNTDFSVNPTRGNRTQFTTSRSLGIFGSGQTWTNLEAEFSQFIPLGRSEWFKQQVLALDVYTSYAPTSHLRGPGDPRPQTGTPPYYEGAYFGGFGRMRGFDSFRFHDRAGIYGSAELRLIPYWNPLGDMKLLRSDIAWMQWVLFAECGRVAPRYVPSDLFTQLKVDGGIGLRILAKDQLVRLDLGFSQDGVFFWAMLGQSF